MARARIVQQPPDHVRQLVEPRFEGGRHRIEPVRNAHEVFHRPVRGDVLEAERDHQQAVMNGTLDLAAHLWRFVGVGRVDEHEDPAGGETVDDRLTPLGARHDVARSDPAAIAAALQDGARGIADGLVLARIADEDLRPQAMPPFPAWTIAFPLPENKRAD